MEILSFFFFLIVFALFFWAHVAISKHFSQTHRTMIIVGLILGCLSLVLGMDWLIAFFVFCFAFYTTACSFRRTKNIDNIPAFPAMVAIMSVFVYIGLAVFFNSIATFFLASVCLCYWGVQYLFAPKKIDM